MCKAQEDMRQGIQKKECRPRYHLYQTKLQMYPRLRASTDKGENCLCKEDSEVCRRVLLDATTWKETCLCEDGRPMFPWMA